MYGGVTVKGLYPKEGPFYVDDIRKDPGYKKWSAAQLEKPSGKRLDMAYYLLTEEDLLEQVMDDHIHGNLIVREDYQRSFKAKTRFPQLKKYLKE
jgi:hypothetical protein